MNLELTENDGIRTKIYEIRGMKVMLDRDLAGLYGVEPKRLLEQVRRNSERFPPNFMFQLNSEEVKVLRSQIATANISTKSRTLPFVFTEYGTLMLASVLNSDTAIKISQKIVTVFVELNKQINFNPGYDILKEQVRRIMAELGSVRSEQELLSYELKGAQDLSEAKFESVKEKLDTITTILDGFQNAHLIIRRPDDFLEPS